MKKIILLLVILTMTFAISAQSNYSPCYTNNMSKGNTAFNQGRYSEAKAYYVNAKQCAGGNPTAAQQKINACDAKIKAQKAAETKPIDEEATSVRSNGYQEFVVNNVKFKMIYVQGDMFTMGCSSAQNDCDYAEQPEHKVAVSDFCIGETEVTQALWTAVTGDNPSYFKGDNLPVENISWEDCQMFIEKLNHLTGKKFRLPTEAEWEYAARGGNKSKGCKYAGSNTIDDVAWYDDNSGKNTHPVKTKRANELGLFDMSGNVFEWCSDWYDWYQDNGNSIQINPTGPVTGSERVLRGGSWGNYSKSCCVTFRINSTPDEPFYRAGFRLVLVY